MSFVRRAGGAVRNALANSLTLAGALRRSPAPQPPTGHAMARNTAPRPVSRQASSRQASSRQASSRQASSRQASSQQASSQQASSRQASHRAPRPHQPRTAPSATPSQPARPGWLARWLPRRRPRAPILPALFSRGGDVLFTPEAFPGLGPELCAVLNTPLADCDPVPLRAAVAAFVGIVADLMPPETGMKDAQTLFQALWGRLDALLDATGPDFPPAAEQDAAPAIPAEASPAPSAAPRGPLPATPMAALPENPAGISATAAPETAPDSDAPAQSWEAPAQPWEVPAQPWIAPPHSGSTPSPSTAVTTAAPRPDGPAPAPSPSGIAAHALPRPSWDPHLTLLNRNHIVRHGNVIPFPNRHRRPPRRLCYAARASPA